MNKARILILASSSVILACAALPLRAAEQVAKEPTLVIDNSPVSQPGKAGGAVSYADVIGPAQKAVVSVHSTKLVRSEIPMHPMFRELFGGKVPEQESKQQGLGSGVIVSEDGYILTNNHVIEGGEDLKVALSDGREVPAKVVGSDPRTDIAVLKIEASGLPIVPLTNSDTLRVGDVVFAMGNPLGVGQTVTMGIVSAMGRSNLNLIGDASGKPGYENFIQTDAAINMGNSGGALIDAKGRLIGINTAIISPSRGNIGIGFAIPSNLAASTMQNLLHNGGVVRRGVMGVTGTSLNDSPDLAETLGLKPDQKGVMVAQLSGPDSPAALAGITRGDIIVAIDGKPVTSLTDLRLLIAQMSPGAKVTLTILRGEKGKPYEALTAEVVLGGGDAVVPLRLFPGVTVGQITPELRKDLEIDRAIEGLVVQAVEERSPYRERLAPGVVILEINREPVLTLEQAGKALVQGRNLLYVYYRGVFTYVAVSR